MFKSMIILKDSVYVPDHDHHTKMLEELEIKDTKKNACAVFVRAELSPQGSDFFSDIDTWVFKVDQDIRPDWFVEDYEKERAKEAVKKWAAGRIYIGIDGLEISTGKGYYLKNCQNVTLSGDCELALLASSQVGTMLDSSQVGTMLDSSQVGEMWGSSQVGTMLDSSQVGTMLDSSQVGTMWGSSTTIIAENWSKGVNIDGIILCDNATIKDNRTKTLYQSGDWKLVVVGKEAKGDNNGNC